MTMTVREAGKLGGLSNLYKFGRAYFVRIGKIGGLRTKALHGHQYKDWGRKGGRPRKLKLQRNMGQESTKS